MTPEQLRIETLNDSVVTYYDNKADFFLREGDVARAGIYSDSIIRKLANRNISGPAEPRLRLYLAHAYAVTGQTQLALREVERAKTTARAWKMVDIEGRPELDQRVIAGILGYAGQYEAAVRELRNCVRSTSWTPAGLALEPKVRALRGNPLFETFAREN
jgi:hypothetical protein